MFARLCPLYDRGYPLTAAYTHRLEAVAGVAALHLVEQRGHDPAAGGADRVANRDAGAIGIEAVEVIVLEAPFAGNGQYLGSEGFVQLDDVHVLEAQAGATEGFGRGRDRADAHVGRVNAGDSPGHELSHRLEAELGGAL